MTPPALLLLPLALPVAPTGADVTWLELPPGAAAETWGRVGEETRPTALPGELAAALAGDPWSRPGTWELWAELVAAEKAALRAGEPADPARRATLCLLARAQGRSNDAWEHYAALRDHPTWTAALTPHLIPGVPLPPAARATIAGRSEPLPDGVLLTPLSPPAASRARPDQVGWRSATVRGLRVGEATLDLVLTVEPSGVQIDLTHVSGGAARLALRIPEPEGFEIRIEYLDWLRREELGEPIEVVLEPGEETRSLYARVLERYSDLPTSRAQKIPAQILEGALVFQLDPGDGERGEIERLTRALAGLLEVDVLLAERGQETASSATTIHLPEGEARDGHLRYLAGAIECFLLGEAAPAASPAPLTLEVGDRIVFLGDSITHAGHYVAAFEAELLARYPYHGLTLFNAGLAEDGVAYASERLDAEVIAQDPDLVFVLLGMNDAGYAAFDERRLATFERGVALLTQRLEQETQARLVLLAPTFYDASAAPEPVPDYDATLRRYGEAVRRVALERGHLFADPSATLRAWTERARERLDADTLLPDGVHPDARGGLAIAVALEELLGPAEPPRLVLAAQQGGQPTAPTRQPRPLAPECAGLAAAEGIGGRLSLDVSALPDGRWELDDGVAAFLRCATRGGQLVEEEWLADSPWDRQAAELWKLVERHRQLVCDDIRNQVWRVRDLPDAARRAARFASIHEGDLRFSWLKIGLVEERLAGLARPRPAQLRLKRVD